jgi:hypothetical protein
MEKVIAKENATGAWLAVKRNVPTFLLRELP